MLLLFCLLVGLGLIAVDNLAKRRLTVAEVAGTLLVAYGVFMLIGPS